jgi:hypothetical protein
MNLEEYLTKIIKLAKKNDDDLEIVLDDDKVRIEVNGSKGDDNVDWHLCKSLDEQPNKEELKSFLKKF